MANERTWPPSGMDVIRSAQNGYESLYRGGAPSGTVTPGTTTTRETAFAGGIVKKTETTVVPGEGKSPEGQIVVPLPATISRAKSRLLFGEALSVTAAETSKARLTEILTTAAWDSALSGAAELCSALGDIYLSVAWDDGDRPMVIPRVLHPSKIHPTFRWKRLTKATVETVLPPVSHDPGVVWRHLEHHLPGRIVHELWRGRTDKKGSLRHLDEHPSTAGLAPFVDADMAIATGSERLTIKHVPNALPSTEFPGHEVGENLGRSDYCSLEGLFWAHNEANRGLLRDERHGRSRIVVSEDMLEGKDGNALPLDREIFVGLGAGANADDVLFQHTQGEIRLDAHVGMSNHYRDQILQAVGLGAQALGLGDGSVGQTATEIIARDAITRQTREEATRIWTPALSDFYTMLLEVDKAKFGGPGPGPDGVAVEFPPAATPSIEERARTVQAIVAANACSIRQAVTILHPDWTPEQVTDEVNEIRADNGMAVDDPGAFPG